jgi:hypothetical protein
MDHRTRLPSLPALEKRAHGRPRLVRGEPVQIELGIRPDVLQRIT